MEHLPPSQQMDLSLRGAIQTMVAIALLCKISSGMCSRFSQQVVHLQQSWQMDLSLRGTIQTMVAIALLCKISSGMCSGFSQQVVHLQQSWQMDLSLRGATQIWWLCKISSGMCSRFSQQVVYLQQSWQMDLSLRGATQTMVAVQDQLGNVQQIQSTSGAFAAILADGSVVTWGDPDYGGCARSAQECAVDSVNKQCICSNPRRWICRYVGRPRLWWR